MKVCNAENPSWKGKTPVVEFVGASDQDNIPFSSASPDGHASSPLISRGRALAHQAISFDHTLHDSPIAWNDSLYN